MRKVPSVMQEFYDIQEYALIGDCHGSALVSRTGSIDWCCLGRFDADPLFCRLLDPDKGGFFSIQPDSHFELERGYLPRTNILQTRFRTKDGELLVTDSMPVGRTRGSGAHNYVDLVAPNWLVRRVECRSGRVPVRIRYRPTIEWARTRAVLNRTPDGLLIEEGPCLYGNLDFEVEGDAAETEFVLSAGEHKSLVATSEPSETPPNAEFLDRALAATSAFWQEWTEYCRYDGPHKEMVLRSALTLKLLVYAPSGAMVAAPTTSLPEELGGQRNWDYRFCWLRDAAFMLYALAALGYSGEARRFSQFLEYACQQSSPGLQIMYGIEGESNLDEVELEHLRGYANSRPVRTGNAAHHQRQLDIYGEMLDWAWLNHSLGDRLKSGQRKMFRTLTDFIMEHWQEPGQGIWEMRGDPRHHVYGKMMCWATLDRAIRLLGSEPRLDQVRDKIRRSILEHGIDPDTGALRQAYNQPGTDAALLLAPMIGFPLEPVTLEATLAQIESSLGRGDFLLRYATEDGLSGEEGAFLICSFWLVNAKLVMGRIDEARELFERLLHCANDVGLYSEEIEPETGRFLGNFPQAFTHLALIECAVNLQIYEEHGAKALQGTHADRARHSVEATSGLRALWAAFKKTGRVGRLWPSRRSIFPREGQ